MRLFKKQKKKFTLLYNSEIQNWRIKINRRLRVLPYTNTFTVFKKLTLSWSWFPR
jgi:hypothetical protein